MGFTSGSHHVYLHIMSLRRHDYTHQTIMNTPAHVHLQEHPNLGITVELPLDFRAVGQATKSPDGWKDERIPLGSHAKVAVQPEAGE